MIFSAVVVVVGYWLLRENRHKKPNILNLRRKLDRCPMPKVKSKKRSTDGKIRFTEKKERNLDCIFMFNGHAYNAYEVLGVPAGASMKMVTDAYNDLLLGQDEATQRFMRLAYEAIKES